MSKDKENGTATVAAPKGATEKTKGNVLVVTPTPDTKKENPVNPQQNLEETLPKVVDILKKSAPLTADERLKRLPIINSLAEKISKLEGNYEAVKTMKAQSTGIGEKLVLHLQGNKTLDITNPIWVDKILTMMLEAFETKVGEAKAELQEYTF